jgi:hypothetical protein
MKKFNPSNAIAIATPTTYRQFSGLDERMPLYITNAPSVGNIYIQTVPGVVNVLADHHFSSNFSEMEDRIMNDFGWSLDTSGPGRYRIPSHVYSNLTGDYDYSVSSASTQEQEAFLQSWTTAAMTNKIVYFITPDAKAFENSEWKRDNLIVISPVAFRGV